MSYHPARAPEPGTHPFVGWFRAGATVTAITAVLAIASGAAPALYASVAATVCFLLGSEFYRRLGRIRSLSVGVRGRVSGVTVRPPDRRWRWPLRALTRLGAFSARPLTPDMTPDTRQHAT
jgi:hypothetical protein